MEEVSYSDGGGGREDQQWWWYGLDEASCGEGSNGCGGGDGNGGCIDLRRRRLWWWKCIDMKEKENVESKIFICDFWCLDDKINNFILQIMRTLILYI